MIAWFWMPFTFTVSSTPVPSLAPLWSSRHPPNATAPFNFDVPETIIYGESPTSRTIYTVVSLACISLLTGMLGYRAKQLGWHQLRTLNLTRILVLILNFLAVSFVTSAAVVESGLGLYTSSVCHSAIAICLAFYLGSKVAMYTFLVERAHAMRAPYMPRRRDWIWLMGMLSIAGGFGSIAICGFLWPISDISSRDGRCRIGLPLKVTIPLLSFDVVINMALTAIFIYLLQPLLRFGGMNAAVTANIFTKGLRRIMKRTGHGHNSDIYPMNSNFLKSIEALLWRSFIGSLLVMLPTVGNLAALYSLQGRELGWLCLTICTFDAVTWAVCVIHWLTVGSTEVDERALALLAQGDAASNVSTGLAPSV
ncbi:hypothetical protein K505DRAFT_394712 [Melanomma pulvis-pyrius CBS 109.77]|uniref:G-protein coupled receptors family 1 profile domain-containing protein n=1 Tax=Melanomma pulvis-pyrius CBS 109.77 TaxID=1314802 RepID=A0A6A6XPW7_9PLEO|nr:hypothetical protein K505DRAFT_394712 [Melanomma pulvis-pyrius CBS 109.77]